MTAKKRKPLDSALEEFVFGTKEAALVSAQPEVVPPAATASLTPETPPAPFALLSAPTASEPESLAAEAIPVQSKENSLTHRLLAPDKEATVRFTVDMSESLHRKLSMLAAKTGRKKVDIVRMLLQDGLKNVD